MLPPDKRDPSGGGRHPWAPTDRAELARLIEFHRCARRSVAQLLDRHRAAGYRLVGAGIVVGSDAPPERIANSHIRAHACEGRLCRTALEDDKAATVAAWLVLAEDDARI